MTADPEDDRSPLFARLTSRLPPVGDVERVEARLRAEHVPRLRRVELARERLVAVERVDGEQAADRVRLACAVGWRKSTAGCPAPAGGAGRGGHLGEMGALGPAREPLRTLAACMTIWLHGSMAGMGCDTRIPVPPR